METPATTERRKTALNAVHRRMGAKMVDFGGWDMPVEYSGIIPEHMAVRTAAGLFDVSHMGEIVIHGAGALELVQHVTSNDASRLAKGQAHYSGLLTERGTFVDDILVHRMGDQHFYLCVNATRQDADFDHIVSHNRFGAKVENVGEFYTQLAIQGPKSHTILQRLTKTPLDSIKYYRFTHGKVLEADALIARTGYTGEDGFEIYFAPEFSEKIWYALLAGGEADGLKPIGLGARNTLRLEAGMCLYGHEIDDSTTVLEAGLGWILKLDKGDFLGRDVLMKQDSEGTARKLVGFEMQDRLIARDGCTVIHDGAEIGRVTSGSPAPFLKKNVGMAYVPAALARPGVELKIGIRANQAAARIVPLPFYKRPK